jgi:outer membrane protein assembly factor BamA
VQSTIGYAEAVLFRPFTRGLRLALLAGVRSLLLLLGLAAAAAVVVVRELPESEAQAEAITVARPQEIRSISFDGRGLPLAALREVLTTKPGTLINLAALARDRVLLEEMLVARGYLAAHVADAHVTFGSGGATFVTFAIEQGPMFTIRNVTITGASTNDAGVVTLGTGEPADASRLTLARQALQARLAVRSAHSFVVTKLSPDLAAGVVDVELDVAR